MILHEITVAFQDNSGEWEEPELYKIVPGESDLDKGILSMNSPLVKKVLEIKGELNTPISLSTNKKFQIIHKVAELELEDYINNIELLKREDSHTLISLGNKIPILLAQSIEVPEKIETLCGFIVSIKLEQEDLLSCKNWLEQLENYGINLHGKLNKINLIIEKQQGIEIRDIRKPYTLNTISQLYIELNAIQKAKNILLHSLNIEPNNSYTLVQLGKLHRVIHSYQEGITYYNKALKANSNSYAYNGLGALYRDVNMYSLSIECYLKSLEINKDASNLSYAYKGLGAVYFELELYDEGSKYFELAGVDSRVKLKGLYDEAISNNLVDKAKKILSILLLEEHQNY